MTAGRGPAPVRVAPRGNLLAVAARGTLMGNRGRLHDADGTVRRETTSYRAWVCCLLCFNGRGRRLRAPDRYTELFFLDEATALSAGHRPCGMCRRHDLRRFQSAVARAEGRAEPPAPAVLDRRLHDERLPVGPARPAPPALLATLPPGAMVEADGATWLWWAGRLSSWRPDGYGEPRATLPAEAAVLTPPTMLAALRGGYRPAVHSSAMG